MADLSNPLGRESTGLMPGSDPSFSSMLAYLKLPERFRQLQLLKFICGEAEQRFREHQYDLRKEMEKDYWRNRAGRALAAKSARMLRDLECSILKPHNNGSSQEEKPWTTVSGHGGFGETSQPYCVNNISQVRGFGTSGDPNLAGSSSGFHFQQQEMSGGEAVRMGISDEYYDHIPCGASNSSAFGQDTALPLYHNQPNPSNGDAIIEIREEGNNLSGNPWMPNLASGETNFAVASSSGINKLGGDDSESSTVAQDVPPGSFHNQPEASKEHNHNKKKDAAHETRFWPGVNTMLAAIAGQASVNLITSGSTHDSMYLRLFAATSGTGFLGSFFSMHFLKKPKLAKVLSKIGAAGTVSSIILSLGINILQDTNWYLKVVGHVAIAAGCLISGVAVVMAD